MKHRQRRGRTADWPSEVPASGWWDITRRIAVRFYDDQVMLIAGGVTYYLLLALVPMVSSVISTIGFLADPAAVQNQTSVFNDLIPEAGQSILSEQLEILVDRGTTQLGLTFVASTAFAIWSANAGMKSLFDAMNVAYREIERRSILKLNLMSLLFVAVTTIGILTLAGAVVALPLVLDRYQVSQSTQPGIALAFYAGIVLIASFAAAALFRWGPDRTNPRWRWITPGMVLSVTVVTGTTSAFFWYLSKFSSYTTAYGSLGALIGFMTWIWISVILLIVGGLLNAESEHQTARDTTVPPDKAIGSRGATMADHVAGDDPASRVPFGHREIRRHGERALTPAEESRDERNARFEPVSTAEADGGPSGRRRAKGRGSGSLLPTFGDGKTGR